MEGGATATVVDAPRAPAAVVSAGFVVVVRPRENGGVGVVEVVSFFSSAGFSAPNRLGTGAGVVAGEAPSFLSAGLAPKLANNPPAGGAGVDVDGLVAAVEAGAAGFPKRPPPKREGVVAGDVVLSVALGG